MILGELDWVKESSTRFHSVMEPSERRFYQIERAAPRRWRLYLMIRNPRWSRKLMHQCDSHKCCKQVANVAHAKWLSDFVERKEHMTNKRGICQCEQTGKFHLWEENAPIVVDEDEPPARTRTIGRRAYDTYDEVRRAFAKQTQARKDRAR